jgi:hypothetical protein
MLPTYSRFPTSANEDGNRGESRKLHMTLPPIPVKRLEWMKLEDSNYLL